MKLSCQFLQQQSACFVSNCTLANFPHHYHHERQQAGRRADAMATSSSQRLCFFLEPNILSLCVSICVRSVLFTKSSGENREEEENLNCKNYHMPRAKKECEREHRATQRPEHSEPIQDLSEGQWTTVYTYKLWKDANKRQSSANPHKHSLSVGL